MEDGRTGFVVHRGNDDLLVDRIVELIADRDLCHSRGEAGRMKSERAFSLNRLVTEPLAAYRAAGWKDVSR